MSDLLPPEGFMPLLGHRKVEEGVRVLSKSGEIEGRTTGSCRPCQSNGCPGWFIGVRWETGQLMHICSQGWKWHPEENVVRVIDGGEISARFVAPAPLGTPPLPKEKWKDRDWLMKTAGWRVLER
jgi:hypothetical protein